MLASFVRILQNPIQRDLQHVELVVNVQTLALDQILEQVKRQVEEVRTLDDVQKVLLDEELAFPLQTQQTLGGRVQVGQSEDVDDVLLVELLLQKFTTRTRQAGQLQHVGRVENLLHIVLVDLELLLVDVLEQLLKELALDAVDFDASLVLFAELWWVKSVNRALIESGRVI